MRHFILVSYPTPDKDQEFIGPFDTAEERDAECERLTKEEISRTRQGLNKMTKNAVSYFRTEVRGLVPGEILESKEVAAA